MADPLRTDNEVDLRLQVLNALVNGGWIPSPWLHWTLDLGVANQYLKEARLKYGDERSYVIRVALPDPRTARCLALGECIRLDSEHEVRTFFDRFMEVAFVRELVVRQRRGGG